MDEFERLKAQKSAILSRQNEPRSQRSWRFIDGNNLKAQFQFEPRDVWVGLFWRRTEIALHLYICILPLVPLHITIRKERNDRR